MALHRNAARAFAHGGWLGLGFLLFVVVQTAWSQGTRADYERAKGLESLTAGKVLNARVEVRWIGEGRWLSYRRELPEGQHQFVLMESRSGISSLAFDHQALASALTRETGKPFEASKLGITDLLISTNRDSASFRLEQDLFQFDFGSKVLTKKSAPPEPPSPPRRKNEPPRTPSSTSPDGSSTIRVVNANLRLQSKAGGSEVPLTFEGTAQDGYTDEIFWSPDSKKVVVLRRNVGQEHKVHYVESSPKDQFQPRLKTIDYLKPGDQIPQSKPHLFDIATHSEIPVTDTLFSNPWEIDQIHWSTDSKRFFFVYNQRGHQVMRVLAVDATTGGVTPIVNEECATFFDYAHKQYCHYLDGTGELLWMSERDGWNHLYLYDLATGRVKNQITRGEWVVRKVEKVDEAARKIWFRAGGIKPGEDPYYVHEGSIQFDGSGLTVLTEGDGTHEVHWSPDREFFVDQWSRVDQPPQFDLKRGATGEKIATLERSEAGELYRTGWRPPERFVAKGRDGTTDIYGLIHRPLGFDSNKKYPVIEHIYAGPQDSYVSKAWRRLHSVQELAELGFIVVEIDGMGTSNRSKKFHDVCWKNLGDAGFPDRILWMKAAAAKYPYLDLSRVGVYGGSAGGQNAMRALIAHGDFYKVAAADCGCHDNRMDKIWWNELWMSWPIGAHYEEASNSAQAHRVQGKLFLIVGEMDDNVDPASTLQVVNALIKADKDFDLLVVPGAKHGAGGSAYGKRRQADFFVRHLHGVEPRSH